MNATRATTETRSQFLFLYQKDHSALLLIGIDNSILCVFSEKTLCFQFSKRKGGKK